MRTYLWAFLFVILTISTGCSFEQFIPMIEKAVKVGVELGVKEAGGASISTGAAAGAGTTLALVSGVLLRSLIKKLNGNSGGGG